MYMVFVPRISCLGIDTKEVIGLVNKDITARIFILHNIVDNSCFKKQGVFVKKKSIEQLAVMIGIYIY